MSGDWRKRYLKLADEADREQKQHAAAERELKRLLTRISVAVLGLDPLLDPHIERLREVAKSGKINRLVQEAGPIGEAMVRAADERTQSSVLPRLLERGPLDKREISEVMRLWAAIAAEPADATDEQLDRLGELLHKGIPSENQAASRGGLLSKLIGRAEQTPDDNPNRHLLRVLQAIAWPEPLQAQVADFTERLANNEAGDAWIEVVQQISDLAIAALSEAQQNARSAEDFLTALNQHLEELDRHMLEEGERRDRSRLSSERLGHEMRSEVGSLSATVRDSVDLAELQSQVLASLERMHEHVRHHLDDENARRAEAEAEAGRLRDELRNVEEKTFDLRRQVARTREAALRDPLTGLPNRRAYDDRMEQEYARWKRFGDPLALLVLDVDDFKKINDTFGHKAGDKTLIMIGKLLRERLRATDFIARFGGEELVVLLVGAGPENATRLAEEMRQAVETGGLHAHGKPVRVTVSGGLALFAAGDSPGEVFERADQAMYRAKQAGKNQVVVASAVA
jgi:diguanylate cyclase